jgi:histone deacetylase 1/2
LASFSETALKQLSELQSAPSVGMHDVPRESVGQHLGFGKDEEEGRDSLDTSLARESHYATLPCSHADSLAIFLEHARFVYNLQDGETHSDDSDDPDNYRWDSDDSLVSSSRRRRRRHAPKPHKKRMSILTNHYFDIPSYENGFEYSIHGKPESRRRFFQTVARWDARAQKVVIPNPNALPSPDLRLIHYSKFPYFDGYVKDIGIEKDSADEDEDITDSAETDSEDEEMSLEY